MTNKNKHIPTSLEEWLKDTDIFIIGGSDERTEDKDKPKPYRVIIDVNLLKGYSENKYRNN
jgi:hypothetical protein